MMLSDSCSCKSDSRAGRLRRLIPQKFFDVLNVALNLRHVRVHRNGAFEVFECLDEVTKPQVAQASATERTKMDGVEGKGLVAIADRLLELLYEVVRGGPVVISLSKIRGHLDHVSENGHGLFESASRQSDETVL